jgi:hypothetical protein
MQGNSWPTQHWSFMRTANGWLLEVRLYRENNDPASGGGVALHSLRILTPAYISTPRPSSKGGRNKREHHAAGCRHKPRKKKRKRRHASLPYYGHKWVVATPGMEKMMKLPCCRTHAAMASTDAPGREPSKV